MDRYDFKKMYSENAMIFAHRGPYNVYDIFQYAIIRYAFTSAYGRGTGIYTCTSSPDDVDKECIATIKNPSKDDVLETWDRYSNVIIPHQAINTYAADVRNDIDTILSNYDSDWNSLTGIFSLFNQTWNEANDELDSTGDMREVFRQRKRIVVDGVNIASMCISRIIAKRKNNDVLRSNILAAFNESRRTPEYTLGIHGYILVLNAPYHIPDIEEAVWNILHTNAYVIVVIQPNVKNGVVVSYYAKAITMSGTVLFRLDVPECMGEYNYKRIDDETVCTFDLDTMINLCQVAYSDWVKRSDEINDSTVDEAEEQPYPHGTTASGLWSRIKSAITASCAFN